MKELFCVLILAGGATFAVFYLRGLPVTGDVAGLLEDRPWRKVGAVIAVLLSIMFVVGVEFLGTGGGPGTYLAYWLVMLVLVIWLCVLAIRDVMYTRRWIEERQARLRELSEVGEE